MLRFLTLVKFWGIRLNPYIQAFTAVTVLTIKGFEFWMLLWIPALALGVWFEKNHSVWTDNREVWSRNPLWLDFVKRDREHKEKVEKYMEAHK